MLDSKLTILTPTFNRGGTIRKAIYIPVPTDG